jgi:hypothetical protein
LGAILAVNRKLVTWKELNGGKKGLNGEFKVKNQNSKVKR